ncbi:hypothetical protein [Fibrobacter sp. UWB5]|jgi:hypothetical protein|uniref:hypothetical protein n=1 Tax=Fibrobacter sp. UWB5 TaxID=1964360 RepID=UPI000B528BB7|nr:hypothetical protein [Fibrobacter sp. UWB5]OWV12327.1 hypothetical protein B7989_07725 [Fibrobacter sp. UWB5]
MSEQTLTRESLVEFFGEEEFKKLCNHEAGHALIAFLFKRPLEYVKMDKSKERPGITHIAGSELEGDAHIAMAGHLAEFLMRKDFACDLDTVMKDLPAELYKSDPDYQRFQAACYYFQLSEANVVEQLFNILMACRKSLCEIAAALNARAYLSRADIEEILKKG